jgi:hypothetical protein
MPLTVVLGLSIPHHVSQLVLQSTSIHKHLPVLKVRHLQLLLEGSSRIGKAMTSRMIKPPQFQWGVPISRAAVTPDRHFPPESIRVQSSKSPSVSLSHVSVDMFFRALVLQQMLTYQTSISVYNLRPWQGRKRFTPQSRY